MAHLQQFEHLKIQLEAIKLATNNFADESCIGRGGFGKVYKGEIVLSQRKTVVALKRLDRASDQGYPHFWKEVVTLFLYKHKNIVSLLGFCDDNGEKILAYEYAPKRSLERYLHNSELTWVGRLNICIGAAYGLAYLHSAVGTQQRVLHRDIKSSNILLDENWNAMISDFGLSKIGPANQEITFQYSDPVGTLGYCDPLYAETGLLTKESDVYSFGVVLFEVLCGRLCISSKNNNAPPLIGLVRQRYKDNNIKDIILDKIKDEINADSLKVFSEIAYQCLEKEREERPSMTEVVKGLENALHCQTYVKCQPSVVTITESLSISDTNNTPSSLHQSVGMLRRTEVPTGGFLVVTIHEGYDLKGKHSFIMLRVGQDIRRTTTKINDRNPVWKETFKFPIDKPPTEKNILHLVVCTTTWMSKTDVLGEVDLMIADVVKEKWNYKICRLQNGRIHVMLRWEPSAFLPKPKPKILQFANSFYNLSVGSGE